MQTLELFSNFARNFVTSKLTVKHGSSFEHFPSPLNRQFDLLYFADLFSPFFFSVFHFQTALRSPDATRRAHSLIPVFFERIYHVNQPSAIEKEKKETYGFYFFITEITTANSTRKWFETCLCMIYF